MSRSTARHAAGISLIEVLVTIIVAAIGLLGFAKMQAAAVSNTQTSRVRSLVALQASSLASAMYGNRAYWGAGLAPSRFTSAAGAIDDATGALSAPADCRAFSCTTAQLAAYDVQTWAKNLHAHFPTATAEVACDASNTAPTRCRIDVWWDEKVVAINQSTAPAASAVPARQQFTLLVEP